MFEYPYKQVLNFGGPYKAALDAQNVRYLFSERLTDSVSGRSGAIGQTSRVRTREGHSAAFPGVVGLITDIIPYFGSVVGGTTFPYDYVLLWNGVALSSITDHTTLGAVFSVPELVGVRLSHARQVNRLFLTAFDLLGQGSGRPYVLDAETGYADRLFLPPGFSGTILTTNVAGGTQTTPGGHYVKLLWTSRLGYSATQGINAFNGVTVAAGQRIRVFLTKDATVIPDEFSNPATITVALSTSAVVVAGATPEFHITPAQAVSFAPGAPAGSTIEIFADYSDEQILSFPPLNEFEGKLTSSSGAPTPTFVCEYRNRMVYGAGPLLYISEPGDTQTIFGDTSVQFIPGSSNIRGAVSFRDGNLYIFTDDSTHVLTDNGQSPSEWSPPLLVDGRIGIPLINCITKNPAKDVCYVCNKQGLWALVGGSYGRYPVPLSFWQHAAWDLIDWNFVHLLTIIDDVEDQTIRINAPTILGEFREFCFDYKRGATPENIAFSMNRLPGRSTHAAVFNPATKEVEIWVGPASTFTHIWIKDKLLTTDAGSPIANQIWQSSLLRPTVESDGGEWSWHGVGYTARGTAVLSVQGLSQEGTRTVGPKLTDLSTLTRPGRPIRRLWEMNSDNLSLKFTTSSGWFELAEARAYYSRFVETR